MHYSDQSIPPSLTLRTSWYIHYFVFRGGKFNVFTMGGLRLHHFSVSQNPASVVPILPHSTPESPPSRTMGSMIPNFLPQVKEVYKVNATS